MRGLKSTILLIVVLAVWALHLLRRFQAARRHARSGGHHRRVEGKSLSRSKQTRSRKSASPPKRKRRSSRNRTATWKIVEPAATDADQTEASGLTTSLTGLEYGRIVEENAADLATYGLADPRFKVAFKGAGGAAGEILLGERTATGTDLFAVKARRKARVSDAVVPRNLLQQEAVRLARQARAECQA